MIKIVQLAVVVLMFAIQSTAYAEYPHEENRNEGERHKGERHKGERHKGEGHKGEGHKEERRQFSPLYAFVPGDPKFHVENKPVPDSEAVLTREGDSLKVSLNSQNLPAGAYTIWVRVFNMPELCIGGEGVQRSQCSRGDDLSPPGNPAIPDSTGWSTSSVFWLAGTIVGEDGIAHVSASVETNNWPGMVLVGTDVVGTEREGVWKPMSAEIHLVIRYHGSVAAAEGPFLLRDPATGLLNDVTQEEKDAFTILGRQLNRVLGGCSPAFAEDAGNCEDLQMAVFSSPER